MKTDVSIIIVNYNCGDYLSHCISSVFGKTKEINFEIIVVDNNSTDQSLALIRKEFPEVKIIENGENLGFGAANNVGAKLARGRYLLLLNPDTILCNNAVKILYDHAINIGSSLGCCGANLLDEHQLPANIGGHFPSLFQLFSDIGFRVLYPAFYRKEISLLSTVDQLGADNRIDSVCGACMMISKNVFEQLNGFDQDYFLYFEDTDLCYRLVSRGYANYVFPDARVIHLESVAIADNRTEKLNLKKFKFFEHGKQLFFKKTRSYGVLVAVKFFTVFYVLTRWIAHRGQVSSYAKMIWAAIKMK